MSFSDLEQRLALIEGEKLTMEIRRFLLNLFLLFDNNPPVYIQSYVNEILDLAVGVKSSAYRTHQKT